MKRSLTAVLALAALTGTAAAHIVLATPIAPAGSYYAGQFRVGHGCDGAATTALRIAIPEGVLTARPQPKPGWTIEIEKAPLATPVKGEGGHDITERVAAITWKGSLEADYFDEFGVMMKLPDAAGPLYFPTIQTCVTGENRWTDIPAAGQAWHDVPHPAPVLELTAAGGDGMAGMHHDSAGAGPISITSAWTRATAGDTGGAFAVIANSGSEPDRLVAVKGDVAASVEIHEMTMAGDVMQMRPVDGLDIPAGGSVELKPGGFHIMLIGLRAPLVEGATIPLTFVFAKAGEQAVDLRVGGPGDKEAPHDHP
jgi:copper(I)-binding protein/uncharacterized protein YcnI